MERKLIWVNEQDMEIGSGSKSFTHEHAILHRAFSLFIIDADTNCLLLQKRAEGKYHSGGLWTNSCCSHPSVGEQTADAVVRRTREELGIPLQELLSGDEDSPYNRLIEAGSFRYRADFETCSECEIDHVFFVLLKGNTVQAAYDEEEMSAVRWIRLPELDQWLEREPKAFTAWFARAYALVKEKLPSLPYGTDERKS